MTSRNTLLAAVTGMLLAGGAQAALITQVTLAPNNWQDFNSAEPTTWDGANIIFSYDLLNAATNSRRSYTYSGTQEYQLDTVGIESSVISTKIGLTSFTAGGDLAVQLQLNGQSATRRLMPGVGLLTNTTPVNFSNTFSGPGEITNRTVQAGTTFAFQFYETNNQGPNGTPDAIYDSDVNLMLNGIPLNSVLAANPNPLAFGQRRAGQSGTTDRTLQIANTGDTGSILDGTAGAATGDANFSGGPQDLHVQVGAPTSVTYRFAASASLGGSTTALASTGSAAIATDGGDATVAMTGQTVGPVFGLSGNGDFGEVEVGSSLAHTLTLANLFGTNFGDLTDLTILNVGLSGTGFTLAGLPGTPFELAAGGWDNFVVTFAPGATTSYSATLTFLTDVEALSGNGGTGLTYTFDLSGTGIPNGGGGQTPAPATLLLLGFGLVGLAARRRQR